MKKVGIILLSLILPFMCFAQIRDYVCTVNQVYSSGSVNVLEQFAQMFENAGYKKTAEGIRKEKNGGFGSGFVYVAEDGTNYIITNRHVVELASECTVTFTTRFGKKTTYEHLTIFALSQDYDIAILKFADGENPFKKGLTISNREVFDTEEVFSAGYPALADKPSWQFASGYVTNDSLIKDNLLSSEISALLQHSAPVDPGSSGGPLLYKNSKAVTGYEVVGINTWKAYGRSTVGISIPGKVINDFISKSLNKNNLTSEEITKMVSDKSKALLEMINKEDSKYTDYLQFVSMKSLDYFGSAFFEQLLKQYDSNSLEEIVDVFVNESITNSMRYAICFALYDEIHQAFNKAPGGEFTVVDPVYHEADEYDRENYWYVSYIYTSAEGKMVFQDKIYFVYEYQGVRLFKTDGLYNFVINGDYGTFVGKNKNKKNSSSLSSSSNSLKVTFDTSVYIPLKNEFEGTFEAELKVYSSEKFTISAIAGTCFSDFSKGFVGAKGGICYPFYGELLGAVPYGDLGFKVYTSDIEIVFTGEVGVELLSFLFSPMVETTKIGLYADFDALKDTLDYGIKIGVGFGF